MKKLPEIDGISVHCAYAKIEPVGKPKPYPKNNKTHPEAQLEMMCKAIKEQGWRAPITVSNQTGYIVRGHARLEAAKRLGLKHVPVDYQSYASEAAERMDRIADNKLAELASWDLPNLKDELQDLDAGDLDMDLTGFNTNEIENLMNQTYVDRPDDMNRAATSPWERVGDGSEGVMFAFGEIQKRVPEMLYNGFLHKVTTDNLEDMLNEFINH